MRIVFLGATGAIGHQILLEMLARGHEVTAVVRDPVQLDVKHPKLTVVQGDVTDKNNLAILTAGHDALISALGPSGSKGPNFMIKATKNLIEDVKKTEINRLLAVGGSGSLLTKSGKRLLDTPEFPAEWKKIAKAHVDALELYRKSDIIWTVLTLPMLIEKGTKQGKYRSGKDDLLIDSTGHSRISFDDYAIALMDELEDPKHLCERFTVAY